MKRKLNFTISSACILDVTVAHNGYGGGDSGHGSYTHITFRDGSSTDMGVRILDENENEKIIAKVKEVELLFSGDAERDCLIEALEAIVHELRLHPNGKR